MVPGELIVFRYINLNVRKLLNNYREENIIQGFILIDNEDRLNYIIIILGLHRYMRTWWIKIDERAAGFFNYRKKPYEVGEGAVHRDTLQSGESIGIGICKN